MQSILVSPKTEEEFLFVKQLLERIKVKATVISEEDNEDIEIFDKAIAKIRKGKAEFQTLSEVKEALKLL
jgi:hypothetical protein